ncbi:hypothetical protein ACD661_13550 [Legionella lytica]|uniref:Uncharacterized protein n=1 Tax=Legionella lytica TaxID=96232 RepID=A0ABW8DA54_9GAMM
MKKMILLGLLITFNSFSCSDNALEPGFGNATYPDMPFNNFAAGHLGVITPHLATSYLTVAYRYFNHLPLNTAEQTNILNVWHDYFLAQPAYPQPVYSLADTIDKFCSYTDKFDNEPINRDTLPQFITGIVNQHKAYFNWREYRLSVLDLPTKLPVPHPRANGEYWTYDIRSFYSALAFKEDNINEINAGPGFNYLVLATERLHAIKDVLDKQKNNEPEKNSTLTIKEELSLWIKAQQQIFMRTMESSEKARKLLAKLPENVPPLVKDDIQYSIAASYLYDGTSEGAKVAAQQFATLANSTTYPWHEWAKYLQYRALNIAVNYMLQSNNMDRLCAENTPCRNLSEQAYEGMLDLSKNATNSHIKEAATDYTNVILMRTKWTAEKTFNTLLHKSLTHIDQKDFTNLVVLSNNTTADRSNEISLWLNNVMNIRSYQSPKGPTFNDAYSHWQNNPQNLAWLWLAVYTIKYANTNQQNALTKAVLNVSQQDPAFIPLRVALITHFADLKEPALEANQKRSIIDDTLAKLSIGEDFHTTTLLLNLRAKFATSLTDFIEHAFFYPKNKLLACEHKKLPNYGKNYIVKNAARIINMLPPSMLMELAQMPNVPDNYRPVLYANLWVRSILFNDKKLEDAVSKYAMKYNPVLTQTIGEMAKSNNSDEKKTLFLKTLLHYPSLSPMINLKLYETWQGNDTESLNSIVLRHDDLNTAYHYWLWSACGKECKTSPLTFLTTAQLKEYQTQSIQINNLASATSYISDSLVLLANRYPQDQQYAELLALFIKYTKYTSGGSKKAFTALKKIYPNSHWAKSTKYYY